MEKDIIKKILESEAFISNPLVLVDLGGSGFLHEFFKPLKDYAIIVTVDADKRDFNLVKEKNTIKVNNIVSDSELEFSDFYLTSFPHCSSRLKPSNQKLEEYSFASFFEIVSKQQLETVTLKKILHDNNLKTIDWFKADTQGTDLRLFKSIPEEVRDKIIVAEFEPGIIDAYDGEDKFFEVLSYMENKNYWADDAVIKGSKRLNYNFLSKYVELNNLKNIDQHIKMSPGWCEISFINTYNNEAMLSERDLLAGIVFSLLKKQEGFALKLSYIGKEMHNAKIFDIAISYLKQFFEQKDSEFSLIEAKNKELATIKGRIKRKLIQLIENL